MRVSTFILAVVFVALVAAGLALGELSDIAFNGRTL
jgi:hypothetical protein